MKYMKKNMLALVVLAAAGHAMAADSVDVKVIGTITPAACTPSLSGGGTVDYGVIKSSELSATDYTVLAKKQLDLAINCTAPTTVAVTVVNGRPNTAAGTTTADGVHGGATTEALYNVLDSGGVAGLGLSDTAKIGGYAMHIEPTTFTADGKSVDSLWKDEGYTSWFKSTTGDLYTEWNSSRYASWAATGTVIPVAIQNLSGKIDVQAYINKTSELDLSKPIQLDGLSTIELVYL